jgi:hypothetical protein
LKREFTATPSSQLVDIYCMFTDAYYSQDAKDKAAAAQPENPPTQNTQPAS